MCAIADHLAIGGNDRTGPPLAHLQHATQMSDSLSLGGGPYHFFDSSSFKAALSSIDSAKSFFSLRFSSSRARSRLASDTSRPPYLAFQLYSVASEIPCLRARSAVFAPASCSRRTAMICSSVEEKLSGRSRPTFQKHSDVVVSKRLKLQNIANYLMEIHCPITVLAASNGHAILYLTLIIMKAK